MVCKVAADGKTSATFLLRQLSIKTRSTSAAASAVEKFGVPGLETNGSGKPGKRDEKGRFTPGGAAGPGRPKKSDVEISTDELLKLARPLDESSLQLLVMQLEHAHSALQELRDRPGLSKEILAAVELQVQTQRMTSVALFKRLHAASL